MALSKPQPRKHLHTRDIQCRGFQRDDGLWDIEGRIVDTKTYSFENFDRGGVASGEPVHHMEVRLTVDDDLVVQKAEASTLSSPYSLCGDINPVFATLEGVTIAPGWRREVIRRMGGARGCVHLTDLVIGPMAVTAHQTILTAKQRRKEAEPGKEPPQLNSCHAYAQGSDIVKRIWPEFYKKS
ncbi:MAG: DUF2889 domain-containing protein [Alphaproteobacteria bacterium]|jgi:hypothetical protein|nr:DUF2889 domain-containing protein [Alphaproteobacteria bacterium]